MDSSEYPSLLSLMLAQTQLANDAYRVGQIIDGLLDDVERLFRAATRQDWEVIARITRRLARRQTLQTGEAVIAAARQLSRTIRKDRPTKHSPQLLAELLQACRDMRSQQRVAS